MNGPSFQSAFGCVMASGLMAAILVIPSAIGVWPAARSVWAQTVASTAFDDAEAQLRVRQTAHAAAVASGEVDELRKALEVERTRVLLTDEERDLSHATIRTLEKNLRDAEARQGERDAALKEAQEARRIGLAAEAQRQDFEKAGGLPAQALAPQQTASLDSAGAGEASEASLGLSMADRLRLQVALAGLGFDPGGADGVLGPRSREAIKAWQKARDLQQTGYLNDPQRQALLREGAPALAKYDAGQRAFEEARLRAVQPQPVVLTNPSQAPPTVVGPRPWFTISSGHRRYHR